MLDVVVRRSPLRAALIGLALAGSTAQPARAQMTRLTFDAGVAHARPPADVEAEAATYAVVGGRLLLGPAFGSVYGGLSTDAASADWLGGALGAQLTSKPFGPVSFALTGITTAFTLGDPTPYDAVTGRVVPEVRLALGRSSLRLRGLGGLGRSDVSTVSDGPPITVGSTTSVVTDLWMYGGGIELEVPLAGARAGAGAEAYESRGGAFYAGYLQARGTLNGWRWELRAKAWETPDDPELEVSFGLGVPLTGPFSLDVSGGRAGPDPLLESPASVSGSAVLSWTAVSATGDPTPIYALEGDNAVVFRLERPGAREVSVLGDFSDWKPVPLERRGTEWVIRLPVEPGIYHFGFLVDGEWYVPEEAPGRVTDEYGRENATLVVPSR